MTVPIIETTDKKQRNNQTTNKKIFLIPQHKLSRPIKPRHIQNYQGQMDFSAVEDSPHIGRLKHRIYPKEWQVPEDFQSRVLAVNPYVDRLLHTPYGVKGMYSFIPLRKEDYEAVLSGQIDEAELPNYVLPYDATILNEDVYLYMASILVDIHDGTRRKQYTKALLRDIPIYFDLLDKLGVPIENIKEVGGITISERGNRLCKSIGFTNKNAEHVMVGKKDYEIVRATVQDICDAIDLDRLVGY